MKFNEEEKSALLALKGVGPTVIKRFEEVGVCSFKELQKYHVEDLAELVANSLSSTCWKNSPHAKRAIERSKI